MNGHDVQLLKDKKDSIVGLHSRLLFRHAHPIPGWLSLPGCGIKLLRRFRCRLALGEAQHLLRDDPCVDMDRDIATSIWILDRDHPPFYTVSPGVVAGPQLLAVGVADAEIPPDGLGLQYGQRWGDWYLRPSVRRSQVVTQIDCTSGAS